ncbi:MAG: carbohydrate kinase [Caulobacterales bacterium]|nr:carbohydrate kinase [Caulobacterales bacterium]
MREPLVVVLDIGKTHTKLSLWTSAGAPLKRAARANAHVAGRHYPELDVAGIELWLAHTLRAFAEIGDVGAIIPVGHGAAVAIIKDDALAIPVMDYEFDPPARMRAEYMQQRDAFSETGSPALGMALNLGLQLHCIEHFFRGALGEGSQILPWPQYWAWRLSGVAASEVTSLGAHTDLWAPMRGAPSSLAVRRGWAERLAPRVHAGAIVGRLSEEWSARTGLKRDVAVFAGLHDSNAALCGARAHAEFSDGEATLISTGTWFVSMRSPARSAVAPPFAEGSGCLYNVDVEGRPAPTALFMGGREIELLGAAQLDAPERQEALMDAAKRIVGSGLMALPTMVVGAGFYPETPGGWLEPPPNQTDRDAAAALYAAMMTNTGLDRIGASGALLIEGRFARCDVFTRALAALRPSDRICLSPEESDVSMGALTLACGRGPGDHALSHAAPFEGALAAYHSRWMEKISARQFVT